MLDEVVHSTNTPCMCTNLPVLHACSIQEGGGANFPLHSLKKNPFPHWLPYNPRGGYAFLEMKN